MFIQIKLIYVIIRKDILNIPTGQKTKKKQVET